MRRAQRNSKADTAKIHHCRRSCRNDIEYKVRPPTWLRLRLFYQSFASPRGIEVQFFGVSSTPVFKTIPCLIFPQGLLPKPLLSQKQPQGSGGRHMFYRADAKSAPTPRGNHESSSGIFCVIKCFLKRFHPNLHLLCHHVFLCSSQIHSHTWL